MNLSGLLDRPIAYHRVFVNLTGSVKAAILLSQAVYWQKRAKQEDGWWYKSAEEWEDETGLTRREQETARKDCGKYLQTDLRGVPATLYWKVNEQELTDSLIQFCVNVETGFDKKSKQDSTNSLNINKNTETTTETTTEVPEVDALTTHITPQLTKEQLREISESANKTMDGILKYGLQKENYFKGRETIADNHLHYADWYHGVTNQVCTKKAQRSWWKAFREWQDAELSISDLQMSYDEEVKWRKFITDPNELTKKAIAIKASESKKPPQEDQVKTDSSGAPISYG